MNDAMNALSHLRSRPRLLVFVVMGLVAGHAILFYRLHYAGAPVTVVSGLVLLVIAKHLGLLAPLYSLLRRRSRMPAARHTDEGRGPTSNDQPTFSKSRGKVQPMTMPPRLSKLALTTHITCSVGWLGAVAGFFVLSIAGVTSHNAQVVRGAYLSMNLMGLYLIVPLSLAALTTGLVQSLGTEWGLLRHYWVLTKLTLTIGATCLLMLHQFRAVEVAARRVLAVEPRPLPEIGRLGTELVSKAALAVLALLVITTLSVFKPWGLTPYGRRKRQDRLSCTTLAVASTSPGIDNEATASVPLGFKVFAIVTAIVIVIFGMLHHLPGGGPMHHDH